MKQHPVHTAWRSLHGELATTLRAVWRRRAEAHRLPRRHLAAQGATSFVALLALGAAALVFTLDLAAAPPADARAEAPARHAEALRDLRAQRFARAYGGFAALADAGHAPSALTALVMVADGETLFGSQWSATPGQLRRWNAMATGELRERIAALAQEEQGDE